MIYVYLNIFTIKAKLFIIGMVSDFNSVIKSFII